MLACVFALDGCDSVEDVRIIGRCELTTGARLVVAPPTDGSGVYTAGAGILGDLTLVSWTLVDGSADARTTQEARWFDGALAPAAEPFAFGTSRYGYRSVWVRDGSSLWGQVWADPTATWPPAEDAQSVYGWRVPSPGAEPPSSTAFPLRLLPDDPCTGCADIGLGFVLTAGVEAALPAARFHTGSVGALTGPPAECGDRQGLLTDFRLMLVGEPVALGSRPVLWGATPCEEESYRYWVSDPWLVSLDGGETLGALFRTGYARPGEADGALRFLRIDASGEPIGVPRRVGAVAPIEDTDTGFQPRAATLPGGRVIFTDRQEGPNQCHRLRVMHDDGTDASDAPWQPACAGGDRPITNNVELLSVPGGAVFVWSERTRLPGAYVTSRDNYVERVRAALLTPEGQRGSEIIDVTDAEATTLYPFPRTETMGPVPGNFLPAAAADGAELAVVWQDGRESAPGVYARRLRCTVDP